MYSRQQKPLILNYSIVGVFLILFLSLFKLQIIESTKYTTIAEKNFVRIKTVFSIRGEIYDRKYRSIVLNKPSYNLYISLNKIQDKKKVTEFISQNFDLNPGEINKIIYDNRFRLYKDVLIVQNINFAKMVKISEQMNYYPSLSLKSEKIRNYLYNNHFTGYTDRINENEYAKYKEEGYSINSYIGKGGLEKYYETLLRGTNGYQLLQVDASGQNLQFFKHNLDKPPVNGTSLILTIDNDLQNYISSIFPKGKNGAIVVMDVKTGGILAYVSKPDFNQNIFSENLTAVQWSNITNDPAKPMLDRIIHGTYPPASVFKPIMATLALEEEVINEKTKLSRCEGGLWFGNRYFKCWWEKGHGRLNVTDAIKYSCDVFFYDLSTQFSLEQINNFTKENMLTIRTGIDLPGERKGFFPTRKWYIDNYGKYVGIIGHKVNLAIGQGEVLVTPLQICAYYAALGNNGNWLKPHLLMKTITDTESNYIQPEIRQLPVSQKNMKLMQQSLFNTVNESYGTGVAASLNNVSVYGKTGSAENHMGKKTHAWFAGYAKQDEFEIAFVVFLENAGHGGSVSAPIARRIIQYYYNLEKS
jgi:penicillin-binding protein 2